MGAGVSMFFRSRALVKKNEKQSRYVSLRDLLEKDQTSLSVTSCITSIISALCSWGSSHKKTNIGGVKKNEKQSSYVSLRDLLEKDQPSLPETSCITSITSTLCFWGSSPTKTEIAGCGSYTTVEIYDKRNLGDGKLSPPSFVSPFLNHPNECVFDKIGSKLPSKEGLKEKRNNNPLPQRVVENEDTMVKLEKVLKGRIIEDLNAMLLEAMTRLETNGRLRVHIVLEQVDGENEEKDTRTLKEGVKLVTRRV